MTRGAPDNGFSSLLYVSFHDPSVPGGPNVNEREFAVALWRALGEKMIMATPALARELDELPAPVEHVHPEPESSGMARWIPVACADALRVWRLRRRTGSPLIVIRMGNLPVATWLLVCVLRQPVAVKSLGRYWITDPCERGVVRFVSRARVWMTNAVVRGARCADTVTPELARRIAAESHRAEPVHVIANATSMSRFSPAREPVGDARSAPVVGYVGTSPSKRGARQLVEVVHALHERYPGLRAVIAGWDEDMPDVQQRAQELGVEAACEFLGQIPYENVPDVIRRMHVGVSLPSASRIRGIGTSAQKVRQYLACGVPVLTVPDGHDFLLAQHIGACVDSDSLPDVIAGVSRLLDQVREEGDKLTRRARAFAEEALSIDGAVAQRLDLWARCLGRQRDGPDAGDRSASLHDAGG